MSITCPICKMTSHHPDDERFGWCANCDDFTGPDLTQLPGAWVSLPDNGIMYVPGAATPTDVTFCVTRDPEKPDQPS